MSDGAYSLWLLPEPSAQAELTALVDSLAPRFGQPSFVPHVTVQGDIADSLAAVAHHARAIAQCTGVQHWPVSGVESTAHFFRCLYLRFPATPDFEALQRHAQALTGTAAGLSPYPHLSLAYGELPPTLAGLPASLAAVWAGRRLTLDRLAVCRSSKDLPIAEWDCCLVLPLATG